MPRLRSSRRLICASCSKHATRTRVSLLDDADDPGVCVEVIERASMRDANARGIAEARARDVADPVRIIDASAAA